MMKREPNYRPAEPLWRRKRPEYVRPPCERIWRRRPIEPVRMVWANVIAWATHNSGASTNQVVLTGVTAGHLIVIMTRFGSNAVLASPAVDDDKGNTYTAATAAAGTNSSLTQKLAAHYAYNVASGTTTVTVHFDVAPTIGSDVFSATFSGGDATDPFDVAAYANGSAANPTSGTVTVASANSLAISQSGVGANPLQTAGTGSTFTRRSTAQNYWNDAVEDDTAIASGSKAGLWDHAATNWQANFVVFKLPAAGGGGLVYDPGWYNRHLLVR